MNEEIINKCREHWQHRPRRSVNGWVFGGGEMKNPIPYPLRSARITLDINPFGFWWKPEWFRRVGISEQRKADGETQWWFRWLWFQISFGRWV